jgi:Ala-tRNA(Pro) deacylase
MEEEMRKLLELFTREGVEYQLYEHEPVYTSEQASKVRGVELKTGVKALVLKTREGQFMLADIAADEKADLKKLQQMAKTSRIHFASREEVLSVTHCEPGSVHPFGSLFGIPTYLDRSVLENEFVNFNIGVLTKSARIRVEDLTRLLDSTPSDFSKGSRSGLSVRSDQTRTSR